MSSINKKLLPHTLNLNRISILTLLITHSIYSDANINPSFLEGIDDNIISSLSQFDNNDELQPEGVYNVDLYLNKEKTEQSTDVKFKKININNKDILFPCFTQKQLSELGILPSKKNKNEQLADNPQCILFHDEYPGASFDFSIEKLQLFLSFPQSSLNNQARGFVSPELWDDGINALTLNYQFSGQKSVNSKYNNNNQFLNLQTGINAGPWRFKNNSTWRNNNSNQQWNNISNYVERGISSIKSRIFIGDTNVSDGIFDSVNFRGIKWVSDDEMYPESQRGFAPTIRGFAKTNALITVRQNNNIIYEKTVTPGEFVINDLYSSSGSGDLIVTIKEEDGTETRFIQPYATVPLLQREGRLNYTAVVGKYENNNQEEQPYFSQFSLLYGLSDGLTLYGGSQLSGDYQAVSFGIGKNLKSFGGASIDITSSNSKFNDEKSKQGQSLRFLYSKSFSEVGTHFSLMGYRYSTSNFYTFNEHNSIYPNNNQTDEQGYIFSNRYHKKSQFQLSVSQSLNQYGSFYTSYIHRSFWNNESTQRIQVGYNTSIKGISYNMSYGHEKSLSNKKSDNNISLTASIPLDLLDKKMWMTASYNNSSNNSYNTNIGVNGTLLEDNNLSYRIQQYYNNNSRNLGGSTNLNYKGTYNISNIGYSYSKDNNTLSYGIRGAIIAHEDGLTLSQPFYTTSVLVSAPGAAHARVKNNTGVSTDYRGYALLPYSSPYRKNRIMLDATTLGDNIDLDETAVTVIPTKGAIVKAKFATSIGYRFLIKLDRNNKSKIPFGSAVYINNNNIVESMVGDNNDVYLNGIDKLENIKAQWGDNDFCIAKFKNLTADDLKETSKNSIGGIIQLSGECL
ncbi:fimbria/pilus outer membrane usher protein [Moellerella wisconsensis]|uniref:fimbria/pilus outer membrane usher protein n=1 Tax=Moellerella wisconsensis TaxID=158849 RepID=UPI0030763A96